MPDDDGKRSREELAAALLLLMSRTRAALSDLADQLEAGEITAEAFGDSAISLLGSAHAEAAALGVELGTGVGGVTAADEIAGLEAALGDTGYMARFVADIIAGRYSTEEGPLDMEAIKRRLRLYAEGLLGTANEQWVKTLDATALITWHDTGDERECSDCPLLADGSPYTPATLPTVPGAGATQCITACRCWLESSTGALGFDLSGLE